MAEIRRLKPNGYTVASTFSGCGGSCLGFKMAGFRHVFASEFIDAARETYATNFPGVHVDGRDIREVTADDVLKIADLKPGELDVLEGSPPCASFSTAGKRSKGWGQVKKYSDKAQRTDDLFFEFTRLLRGLAPRAFVAENVAGLVRGVAKGYFFDILRELKSCGYRVECRVLDAQWLGVPQQRQRTIFMGAREDQGMDPVFPPPLPYRYSIRDALPWVDGTIGFTDAALERKKKGGFFGRTDFPPDEPSPTITAAGRFANELRIRPAPSLRFRTGWQDGKAVSPDEPAPTIMAGGIGGSGHGQFEVKMGPPPIGLPTDAQDKAPADPGQPRKLTIAELRRLGGFPDDFVFKGTFQQQWERVGRAVPPMMMFHVARTLRDEVLAKAKR